MRSGHSNPQNRACGLKVEVVPYYGKMHQTSRHQFASEYQKPDYTTAALPVLIEACTFGTVFEPDRDLRSTLSC